MLKTTKFEFISNKNISQLDHDTQFYNVISNAEKTRRRRRAGVFLAENPIRRSLPSARPGGGAADPAAPPPSRPAGDGRSGRRARPDRAPRRPPRRDRSS